MALGTWSLGGIPLAGSPTGEEEEVATYAAPLESFLSFIEYTGEAIDFLAEVHPSLRDNYPMYDNVTPFFAPDHSPSFALEKHFW